MTQRNSANKTIRRFIQTKRTQLPRAIVKENSWRICQHLLNSEYIQDARHVALYVGVKGEIELETILHYLLNDPQKNAYLPYIDANNDMLFKQVTAKSTLIKNTFGIPEPPQENATVSPRQLDTVLTPLVAFNTQKRRLGMGGGYYDKTFSFKAAAAKPRLIGCGHAMQHNTQFISNEWDIDLDHAVTEEGFVF